MLETKITENQGAVLSESVSGLDLLFSLKGRAAPGRQTDLAKTQNAGGADFMMLLKDQRSELDWSRYSSSQYVETSGMLIPIPEKRADAVQIHEDIEALSPAGKIFKNDKGAEDLSLPIGLQPIFLQAREEERGVENNEPEDDPMLNGNIKALSLTMGVGMLSASKDSETSGIVVDSRKEGQAMPDEGMLGALASSEKPIDKLVPDRQELRLIGAEDQGRIQFLRTILAEQISVDTPARTEDRVSGDVSGRVALQAVLRSGEEGLAVPDPDRRSASIELSKLKSPVNSEMPMGKLVPDKQELQFPGADEQAEKQFVSARVAVDVHDKTPAPAEEGSSQAVRGRDAREIVLKSGEDEKVTPVEDRLRVPENSERPAGKVVPEKRELRFPGVEDQGQKQVVRTILAEEDRKEFRFGGVDDRSSKQFVPTISAEQIYGKNPALVGEKLPQKEARLVGAEDQGRKQFVRTFSAEQVHEKVNLPLIGVENIVQGKLSSRNIKMVQEGEVDGDFFPVRADVKKEGANFVDRNKAHLNSSAIERTDLMAASAAPLFIKTQDTPSLQAQSLLDQVTEQLPQALGRGSGRIKITLTPPHLGSLDMDVLVRDNRVQVFLTVENRDVQQSLQVHVEKLKEGLQQQGLQVDGLNVLLNDSRHGQGDALGGGYAFWQDRDRATAGKREVEEREVLPSAMESLAQGENRGKGTGGINIFV